MVDNTNLGDCKMTYTKILYTLSQLKKLIDEGENSGDPINWYADNFLTRMKTDTAQNLKCQKLHEDIESGNSVA